MTMAGGEGTDGPQEFLPDWLPRAVCSAVGPVDGRVADLFAEEARLVANAVARRQVEFATGRRLARTLLVRLGHPPAPLLSYADRSPRWPRGVLGAITHTDGLCGVAVAAAGGDLLGIGIDVERDNPMDDDVVRYVLTEAERAALDPADPEESGRMATVAFCLKEAVYKCLYPVGNQGLEFDAVEIDLPSVVIRPGAEMARRIPPGARIAGSFEVRGGFVRAAALLCAR